MYEKEISFLRPQSNFTARNISAPFKIPWSFPSHFFSFYLFLIHCFSTLFLLFVDHLAFIFLLSSPLFLFILFCHFLWLISYSVSTFIMIFPPSYSSISSRTRMSQATMRRGGWLTCFSQEEHYLPTLYYCISRKYDILIIFVIIIFILLLLLLLLLWLLLLLLSLLLLSYYHYNYHNYHIIITLSFYCQVQFLIIIFMFY